MGRLLEKVRSLSAPLLTLFPDWLTSLSPGSLGNLSTIKHLKKDITEARKGMECGLSIDGFTAFKEGDLIQAYSIVETPATL